MAARLEVDVRRAQLLQRGRRLFDVKSYDEVSIDDIAAAAGVSKGLLYHYFPDKRHFYVACVRAAASELLACTETGGALAAPERLRQGLAAYLDYVGENARAYSALLQSGLGADRAVARIVDETREAMLGRLAQGTRPSGPMRVALRGWIGLVEAASLEWVHNRALERDALVELLVAALAAILSAAQGGRQR